MEFNKKNIKKICVLVIIVFFMIVFPFVLFESKKDSFKSNNINNVESTNTSLNKDSQNDDGRPVTNISTPKKDDIGVDASNVRIVTTVSPFSKSGQDPIKLKPYVLQVIDSGGSKLGNNPDVTLEVGGIQELELTGLELDHGYDNVKLVAYSAEDIGGTELASSDTFSFNTTKHIIDGIEDVSINRSIDPTETAFFINLTTKIGPDETEDDIFSDYNIIVTANYDGKTDSVIFALSKQSSYKDNEPIKIKQLKSDTLYSNVKLVLLDGNKNILGEQSSSLGSVRTKRIISFTITDPTLGEVTNSTFAFNFNINSHNSNEIKDYKIQVIADYDDNVDKEIWLSSEQYSFGKCSVQVSGLPEGKEFTNIRINLLSSYKYDFEDPKYEFYDSVDTGVDIVTTNTEVDKLIPGTGELLSVGKTDVLFNVDIMPKTGVDVAAVFPYRIGLVAKGYKDPIWVSDPLIWTGRKIEFHAEGLKRNTPYYNIHIKLLDVNTKKPSSDEFAFLSYQIRTLGNPDWKIMSFSLVMLFILIIMFLLIRKIPTKKKNNEFKDESTQKILEGF